MATSENKDIQVNNDPRDNILRYIKDIEGDITPARKLLEGYSKVPPDQVVGHIHAVVCLPAMFLYLPVPHLIPPLEVFFSGPTS